MDTGPNPRRRDPISRFSGSIRARPVLIVAIRRIDWTRRRTCPCGQVLPFTVLSSNSEALHESCSASGTALRRSACSGCATTAHAQVQTGSITGTVTDTSNAVLPGVTVTLTGERLIGGDAVQVTDASGTYRFDRLSPGSYTVKFELQGFKTRHPRRHPRSAPRSSRRSTASSRSAASPSRLPSPANRRRSTPSRTCSRR